MGRLNRDEQTGWWIADYFDAAGKRHRLQVSQDAAEARDMLALLEGKAVRDRLLEVRPLKAIRFGEFAEVFLKHARTQMRAWRRYETSLGAMKSFFGNLVLTAIDAEMIEKFKQARQEKVERSTVNHDLQCLRRMFNVGIVWGYARENPMRFVRLFREKSGRLRYLTREEFDRLLSECSDELRPIVTVAVHTGMRQGEILALTWADMDFENGFASVNDPKNGTPRKVPLNATAREALQAASRTSVKVFPIASRTLQWQFKRTLRDAKIEDFRFHDLRHTCASWLAMANVPILAIREVLGHKDIRMTLRYAHLAPDQKVDAVKRLDAFWQRAPSEPMKMGH